MKSNNSISGNKIAALEKKASEMHHEEDAWQYITVCDYNAQDGDELSVIKHELVEILDQGDPNFYLVRKYDPSADEFLHGWVPICILEKREDFEHSSTQSGTDPQARAQCIRANSNGLIESERQYTANLKCFLSCIRGSLCRPNCPEAVKSHSAILLCTMEHLFEFHSRVLTKHLVKFSDSLYDMAQIFLSHKATFNLYIDYFSDMNKCEMLFRMHPEMVNFLDDWLYRMSQVDDRPLMFYLTRPIERLEYYRDFFKRQVKLCGGALIGDREQSPGAVGNLHSRAGNTLFSALIYACGIINNVFNQIRYRDLLERVVNVNDIPHSWNSLGDVLRYDQLENLYIGSESFADRHVVVFAKAIVVFWSTDDYPPADEAALTLKIEKLFLLENLNYIKERFSDNPNLIQLQFDDNKPIFLFTQDQFQKKSITRCIRIALLELGLDVQKIDQNSQVVNRYRVSESSMDRDSLLQDCMVEEYEMMSSTTDVAENGGNLVRQATYSKRRNVNVSGPRPFYSQQHKVTRYDRGFTTPERLASQQEQIILLLEDRQVQEGSPVSLRCAVRPSFQPSYALWYKDGALILDSLESRQLQRLNEFELILKSCSSADAGTYSITVFNNLNQAVQCACNLRVCGSKGHAKSLDRALYRSYDSRGMGILAEKDSDKRGRSTSQVRVHIGGSPPRFVSPLYPVSAYVGESATLQCKVYSSTAYTNIEWWKDGRYTLGSENPNYKFHFNHETKIASLHIRNLQLPDSGVYTLKVRNQYGEATSETQLDVFNEYVRVGQGSDAYIYGPSDMPSDVPLRWYKESVEIQTGPQSRFTAHRDALSQGLRISKTRSDDQGTYTCCYYSMGDEQCPERRYGVRLSLMLNSSSDESLSPERSWDQNITRKYQDLIISNRGTALFRTACVDTNVNQLLWLHKGEASNVLRQSRFESRKLDDHTHELVIRDVGEEDAGEYCARRLDRMGRIVEEWPVGCLKIDNRQITIRQEGSGAYVLEPLTDQHVSEGGNCLLTCRLNKPNVPLTWYKTDDSTNQDRKLPQSQKYTFTMDSNGLYNMQINRVSKHDQGHYYLVSSDGKIQSSANIVISGGSDKGNTLQYKNVLNEVESTGDTLSIDRTMHTGTLSMRTSSSDKCRLIEGDHITSKEVQIHQQQRFDVDKLKVETTAKSRVYEGDTVTINLQSDDMVQLISENPVCLQCDRQPVDRSIYQIKGSSIVLEDVELSQSGRYELVLPNQNRLLITDITVVQRPPQREFMQFSKTEYVEGESLSLECEFETERKRKPCWYKDNQQIIGSDLSNMFARGHYQVSTEGSKVHRLNIPKLTKDDEGRYELRCGNFVLSTPYIGVQSLRDLKLNQVHHLQRGDTLNVDVNTNDSIQDASFLKLFRNDIDVTHNGNVHLEQVDSNSVKITLNIIGATDEGSYYLDLNNCRQYLCTVVVKRIAGTSDGAVTRIQPAQSRVQANIGEGVSIGFRTDSPLEHGVSWLRNNEPIEISLPKYRTEYQNDYALLKIQPVCHEDSGYYALQTTEQEVDRCSPVLLEVCNTPIDMGIYRAVRGRDLSVHLPLDNNLKPSDGMLISTRRLPGTSILDKTRCFVAKSQLDNEIMFCINAVKLHDAGKFEITFEDHQTHMKVIYNFSIEVTDEQHDTPELMAKPDDVFVQRQSVSYQQTPIPVDTFAASENHVDIRSVGIPGAPEGSPKHVHARVAESLTIQMEIQHADDILPTIVLLRNGQQVGPLRYTISKDDVHHSYSICLSDLQECDSGLYSVDVGNGYVIPAVQLLVLPRPHQLKTLDLKKTTFQHGETFQLDVDVSGPALAKAVWRKDGRVLTNAMPGISICSDDGKYTLKVSSLTNSHSGVYSLCLDNLELVTPFISVVEGKPELLVLPAKLPVWKTLRVKEFENVDLEASLNVPPATRLDEVQELYKNGYPTGRYIRLIRSPGEITEAAASLEFKKVRLADSGTYGIKVDDNVVNVLKLEVSKRDKVIKQLDLAKTIFYEGDKLQLDVSVDQLADIVPSANWSKDQRPLWDQSSRIKMSSYDSERGKRFTIEINNLNPSIDSGVYMLSLGDDYVFYTPYLTVLPRETSESRVFDVQNVTAFEGENVDLSILTDKITSGHTARLCKNNNDLPIDRYTIKRQPSGDALVSLFDLRVSDSGLYQLLWDDGSALNILDLTVKLRLRPKIQTLDLGRTEFLEGETLQIDIQMKGLSPDTGIWKKDGVRLMLDYEPRMASDSITEPGTSSLKIETLKPSDSGIYELDTGDVILRTPHLTVKRRLDVIEFVTPFRLVTEQLHLGKPLEFECSFNIPVNVADLLMIKDQIPVQDRVAQVRASEDGKHFNFAISNLKLNDIGDYQICIPPLLSNPVGVYIRPVLSFIPDKRLYEGDNVTFKVDVTAPDKVTLFQFVNESNQVIHSGPHSTFELVNVKLCSGQLYRGFCKMFNESTLVSDPKRLVVLPRPTLQLLDKCEETGVVINDPVKFVVSAGVDKNDVAELLCNDEPCEYIASSLNGVALLTLPHVKDIGKYKVRLKDGTESLPALIHSLQPPRDSTAALYSAVLTANKNVLTEGEILILSCQTKPQFEVAEWYLNAALLRLDSNPDIQYEIVDGTHILIVNNVDFGKHTGEYSCRLMQAADDVRASFYSNKQSVLIVPVSIELESPLTAQPEVVDHGETLQLYCKLRSPLNDNVQVNLLLNGNLVTTGVEQTCSGNTLMLSLAGARPQSHEGDYQLLFVDTRLNAELMRSQTANVKVKHLRIEPSSQRMKERDAFSIRALTHLLIPLKWYLNDQPLVNETNSTLKVMSAKTSQSGLYFCALDDEQSNVVEVLIEELDLSFSQPLTASTNTPEEGSSVVLSCQTNRNLTSAEMGDIHFYRLDGRSISPSSRYLVDDTGIKLIIDKCNQLEDSGLYNLSIGGLMNAEPVALNVKSHEKTGEIRLSIVSSVDGMLRNEEMMPPDLQCKLVGMSDCVSNMVSLYKEEKMIKENMMLDRNGSVVFNVTEAGRYTLEDEHGNVSNEVMIYPSIKFAGPLTVSPSDTIIQGQAFFLTCSLVNVPLYLSKLKDTHGIIGLIKDGLSVDAMASISSPDQDGVCTATFAFNNANHAKHGGVFTCMLPTTKAMSNTVKLSVLEGAAFLTPLKDITVRENSKFILLCEVVSPTQSEAIWTRNGVPVEAAHVKIDKQGLTVFSAEIQNASTVKDSGKWACLVDQIKCECTVEVIPEEKLLRKLPEEITVSSNESPYLDCITTSGEPLFWKVDDVGIEESLCDSEGPQRHIHKLHIAHPREGMVVSCQLNGQQCQCLVHVIEEPTKIGDKCEFVVPLKDCQVMEGDKVEFCCTLNMPNVPVLWTINDEPLDSKSSDFQVIDNGCEHTLVINSASMKHTGKIGCVVDTTGGPLSCANLSVEERPLDIIESLKDVRVNEGEDAVFTACLNRECIPNWTKDGIEVSRVLSERTRPSCLDNRIYLKISECEPSDEGWYGFRINQQVVQAKLTVIPKPPKFVVPLMDLAVVPRSQLKLTCHLLSSPTPMPVTWFKDGVQISPASRSFVIRASNLPTDRRCLQEHTLELAVANENDVGQFECLAESTDVRTSCVVSLTREEVVFLEPLKDIEVESGATAEFSCRMSGPTRPVDWFLDSNLIAARDDIRPFFKEGGVIGLAISRCSKADAGVYSVSIRGTPLRSSANLSVKEVAPVTFVSPLPGRLTMKADSPFKLQCLISDPGAAVTWLRDGKPISSLDNHFQIAEDQFARSLTIPFARLDDAGLYSVQIVEGGLESTCDCVFEEKDTRALVAPRIVIPFSDLECELHSMVEFKCKVIGTDLKVAWFKDGQPLEPNSSYQIYMVDDFVFLRNMNCLDYDFGEYTCAISNSVGTDECSGHLRPAGSQAKLTDLPVFVKKPENQVGKETSSITFDVIVKSRSAPFAQWIFRDNSVPISRRITAAKDEVPLNYRDQDVHHFVLRINNIGPDDYGTYECVVSNQFGKIAASADLQHTDTKALPQALISQDEPKFLRKPGDISVKEGQNLSVDALVDISNGIPELSILKNGAPVDNSEMTIAMDSSGRAFVTLNKPAVMANAGNYEMVLSNKASKATAKFRVAVEDSGQSVKPLKRKVMFDLPEGMTAPPLPPQNPQISHVTPNTNKWLLSWDPSLSDSTEYPVEYIIELKEPGTQKWIQYQANLRGFNYEITDLVPMRGYSFRVRAENIAGISEPSAVVNMPLFGKLKEDASPTSEPFSSFANADQCPSLHRIGEDIQYYVVGQDVDISVLCLATTVPEISWYSTEDQKLIDFDEHERYAQRVDALGYQTLHIRNAELIDAGPYTIQAINEHGSVTHTVYLEPADCPTIIEPMQDQTVPIYDNFELTCKVDGIPYPEVEFLKDGNLLAESHRIKIRRIDRETWQLSLRQAILKDSGLYTCRCRNIAGTALTTAVVSVEEDTLNVPRPGLTTPFDSYKARQLDEDYSLGQLIHENSFTRCYDAVERATGERCVVKITKNKDAKALQENELQILNNVAAQGIVKPKAAYLTSLESSAIVLQRAKGTTIPEFLKALSAYDEITVAKIIRKTLETLSACHSKNIAHLNIKPENVLLESLPNGDLDVNLIGFTYAKQLSSLKPSYAQYGCPGYVSPEQVHKLPVGLPSDMWSIGALTFALLSGHSPFLGTTDHDTLQNVYQAKWQFDSQFDNITSECKDFIQKLLVFDPYNRMTVSRALRHPWLRFADQRQMSQDWSIPSARLDDLVGKRPSTVGDKGLSATSFDASGDSRAMSAQPESSYTRDTHPRTQSVPKDYYGYVYGVDDFGWRREPGPYLLPITDPDFAVRVRGYRRSVHSSSPYIDFRTAENLAYRETIHERTTLRRSSDGSTSFRIPHALRSVRSISPIRYPNLRGHSIVTKKGKPDENAPRFGIELTDTAFSINEPTELSCFVTGKPFPGISWFHNDRKIESAYLSRDLNSSLQSVDSIAGRVSALVDSTSGCCKLIIQRALLSDKGVYQCCAVNDFGKCFTRCTLYLGENPDAPGRPFVVDVSADAVLLRWEGPTHIGNIHKQQYKVDFKEEGTIQWTNAAFTTDDFCVVTNLKPSSQYRFRVSCHSPLGISDYSVASSVANTLSEGETKVIAMSNLNDLPGVSSSQARLSTEVTTERHNKKDFDVIENDIWKDYEKSSEIYRLPGTSLVQAVSRSPDGSRRTAEFFSEAVLPDDALSVLHLLNGNNEHIAQVYAIYNGQIPMNGVWLVYAHDMFTVLDFLSAKTKYTEQTVSLIMKQALDGLEYLHRATGGPHGRLNPFSLLLDRESLVPHVRLTTSVLQGADKSSYLKPPLLSFASREQLLDRNASVASDVWSLGLICYTLLSGHLAFGDHDQDKIRNDIVSRNTSWNRLYSEVSEDAKSFIEQCTQQSTRESSLVSNLLKHRWFDPDYEHNRERAVFASDLLRALNCKRLKNE